MRKKKYKHWLRTTIKVARRGRAKPGQPQRNVSADGGTGGCVISTRLWADEMIASGISSGATELTWFRVAGT